MLRVLCFCVCGCGGGEEVSEKGGLSLLPFKGQHTIPHTLHITLIPLREAGVGN